MIWTNHKADNYSISWNFSAIYAETIIKWNMQCPNICFNPRILYFSGLFLFEFLREIL